MPEIPVDGDPFAGPQTQPVNGDPFGNIDALSQDIQSRQSPSFLTRHPSLYAGHGITPYQGPDTTPQPAPPPEPGSMADRLEAASNIAHRFVDPVVQAATLPGRVMQGQPVDPVSEGLNFAMTMGAPSVKGLAGSPSASTAGMFLGENAIGADTTALMQAKHMAAQGMDRGLIRDATNWFQTANGKWAYEVPDLGTDVSQAARQILTQPGGSYGAGGPLDLMYEHPDVYSAYPRMANIPTQFKPGPEQGGYTPGLKNIEVTGPDVGTVRNVALHEMSHGVSELAGFDAGSNPLDFSGPAAQAVYQRLMNPQSFEDFMKTGGYVDRKMALGQYAQLRAAQAIGAQPSQNLQAYLLARAGEQAYLRNAGEAAARNVMFRRDMTPAELKATHPWETQDVPDEMQILKSGKPALTFPTTLGGSLGGP